MFLFSLLNHHHDHFFFSRSTFSTFPFSSFSSRHCGKLHLCHSWLVSFVPLLCLESSISNELEVVIEDVADAVVVWTETALDGDVELRVGVICTAGGA